MEWKPTPEDFNNLMFSRGLGAGRMDYIWDMEAELRRINADKFKNADFLETQLLNQQLAVLAAEIVDAGLKAREDKNLPCQANQENNND